VFTSNDLVKLLQEAWKGRIPLAHNWIRNPFPGQAQSIRAWCDDRGIEWGADRLTSGRPNSDLIS
jgi:hypothetical protein